VRRDLNLPERDVEYLDSLGLPWETVRDGRLGRVLVHDYAIPQGFKPDATTACLKLEPGYPETEIDMVYFFPHLTRVDGRPVARLAADQFDGKSWQRWSRHRTPQNPWRRGVDDISTHMQLVRFWLERELSKA